MCSISPKEFWGYTLKQFFWWVDACLIDRWDHTSHIQAQLQALSCVVQGIVSKDGPKPLPASNFHPYRKPVKQGIVIRSKEDFRLLQKVGDAVIKGKK